MKLSKNAILAIASTVVLIVSAAINYTESKSEEGHTVVITPNQSQTSQSTNSTMHEETTKLTSTGSAKTKNSKSSKTTVKNSSQTTASVFSFPADINTASFDMLCAVDGIGETTADKILSYRESVGRFKSMYDLLYINGIGEGKLTLLMKYFYVVNDIGSETVSQTTTTQAAQTTTSIKTTYSNVSTCKTSHTTETSAERTFKPVNINTANAKELEESLLISTEMAEEIIEVRGLIGEYVNIRELSMVTNFTNKMLVERRDYILL